MDPEIIITENGLFQEELNLDDDDRINYIKVCIVVVFSNVKYKANLQKPKLILTKHTHWLNHFLC